MVMWVMTSVMILLLGLLSVAFITLLERKVLGLSQSRLGPNKVSLFGSLQPVSDGVKLFLKNFLILNKSFNFLYIMMPVMIFLVFMFIWMWILPWSGWMMLFKHSGLLFFSVLGISAYVVVLTGWSSSSSYSKLGSLRSLLQGLSFEVSIILLFMFIMKMYNSMSLTSETCNPLELVLLWMVLWLLLSLMEVNRAPFDLVEGESELISGFNIEMGSLNFILLFLSEYGMIISMSIIMGISFSGSINTMSMVSVFSILIIRSCFPRVRYDVMMTYMWTMVLPLIVSTFFVISFFE